MKTISLIRVYNLLPFIDFFDRLGSPVERWLEEVKLNPFALEDPESLMPRHLAFAFAEKAARAEGIENFGVLVAQKLSFSDLGTFGRIVCGSFTLHEAFTTIQKIAPFNHSGEEWSIDAEKNDDKTSADRIRFCMRYTGAPGFYSPYATQYALTLMLDLVSLAAGTKWRPPLLYIQTRQTKEAIGSFAGSNLKTGVGFNGVSVPRSFLSLPLRSPVGITGEDSQRAWNILQSSAPANSLSGSLEQALIPLLRGGYPDVRLAAEIVGTSVRTLQRLLGEEGLTYSRLIERIRFDRAIYWLRDPSVQLIDISVELGYSDAAHFSRAFKRWTGLSPREYRQKNYNL